MTATINVQPRNVWALYQSEQVALRTKLKLIASNEEFGVEIYLTNTDERPNIVVCMDDVEVFSEFADNEEDLAELASDVYDEYLTSSVMNHLDDCYDEPGSYADDEQFDIDMRENELDCLVYDFITGVLGYELSDYGPESTDIMDDCKEHFLEYMARKWEIPICRPMYLEDEQGETFFEEYPYECMEYDDPDNPLYQ